MNIYQATLAQLKEVVELALKLWPSYELVELREEFEEEFRELLGNPNAAVLLAEEAGEKVGFAQVELRTDYVEGTSSNPVGYLEGVFVTEEFRDKGVGRKLVQAGENWAREQGCREFGSDASMDNTASQAFHRSVGFQEVNRIVCYVKKLD